MRKLTQEFELFILPFFLILIIRVVGVTLRYHFVDKHNFWKAKKDGRCIFVFWHQKFFPLLYSHKNSKINIMVSHHSDGELIARVLRFLGFTVTRGSTTEGGMRACLLMSRAIRQFDLAITPDGPKGPRYHFSKGAITIAKLSGRPIVPVGIGASRAKYFSSWDRFMLPLPGSKINIIFGKPYYIEQNTNVDVAQNELTTVLNMLNNTAEQHFL